VLQRRIGVDKDGRASRAAAIWPFSNRTVLQRVDQNLYLGPGRLRFVFDDSSLSGAQLVTPAVIFQRVSWYEDAGVIGAALAASTLILFLTLLTWPVENTVDRRLYTTARLVAFGAALAAITLIPLIVLLAVPVALLWRFWPR